MRAADLLVKRYGENASVIAAQRVSELLAAGDIKGRAVWLRIHQAVEELMVTMSPGRVP